MIRVATNVYLVERIWRAILDSYLVCIDERHVAFPSIYVLDDDVKLIASQPVYLDKLFQPESLLSTVPAVNVALTCFF